MKNLDKIIVKWIPLVIGALAIMLALGSCTVYKTPQMHITSVLAVTAQGDTLKLPIDAIRPIYNYNTYPSNRYPIIPNYPFYYSPHRYQPIYGQRPGNNINIPNTPSSSGSGPNVSSPVIVSPPSNPPNPAKSSGKRVN